MVVVVGYVVLVLVVGEVSGSAGGGDGGIGDSRGG